MNQEQACALGRYIRATRTARQMSASELALAAGVDSAQVLRIERGEVAAPQATVLGRIAERLRVPINDLLVLAGYPTSRQLPNLEPYLRAKFPQLLDESIERVAQLVRTLCEPSRARRHQSGD